MLTQHFRSLLGSKILGFFFLRGHLQDHTSDKDRADIYNAAAELYESACVRGEILPKTPIFTFSGEHTAEHGVVVRLTISHETDGVLQALCSLDLLPVKEEFSYVLRLPPQVASRCTETLSLFPIGA